MGCVCVSAPGRAGQKCGGEEFDFGQVVGLDEAPAQAGAAVRYPPAFLVAGELAVKRDGIEPEFLAGLPHQRPTVAAGDAVAMPVGLRRAVDFRSRGNHQFAGVVHVFGDQSNYGSLNRSRVHRNDRFAGDEPAKGRVNGTQRLWFNDIRGAVAE